MVHSPGGRGGGSPFTASSPVMPFSKTTRTWAPAGPSRKHKGDWYTCLHGHGVLAFVPQLQTLLALECMPLSTEIS